MAWTSRVLVIVVIALLSLSDVHCNSVGRQDEHDDIEFNLDRMFHFLRQGDNRLIRYNVPSDDAQNRQEHACKKDINNVMELLASSKVSTKEKNKGIYIITTCVIEHPKNREEIGKYGESIILQTLIDMLSVTVLDEDDNNHQSKIDGSALAAEAIWILSFNNAHNHEYFLSNGAISALSSLIQYENEDLMVHLANMWAAAALQNLAASYCRTGSGHCWWEYNNDQGLHLHPESPLRDELGSIGRQMILDQPGLVLYLKKITCRGPSFVHPWPSEAKVGDTKITPQITTWAVTGVLKNLALHEKAIEVIGDVRECLCDLLYSQDWLEKSKAKDTLSRLGMEGTCSPPYYKNCQDLNEWRNDFGESCALYAKNKWCHEFGHLTSKDGIMARDACCVCNGGERTIPSQKAEL